MLMFFLLIFYMYARLLCRMVYVQRFTLEVCSQFHLLKRESFFMLSLYLNLTHGLAVV